VAIGGCNCGRGEEDDFADKGKNPDNEVDDIGPFAPIEERDEDIEVEEECANNVNLGKLGQLETQWHCQDVSRGHLPRSIHQPTAAPPLTSGRGLHTRKHGKT
jgi:hypothetical protein